MADHNTAISTIQQDLVSEGITLPHLPVSQLAPWLSWLPQVSPEQWHEQLSALLQISYADDTVVPIAASSPSELFAKVKRALDIIVSRFAQIGHEVNMAPGKTEAVLKLFGQSSPEQWREHVALGAHGQPCFTSTGGV
eukprot:7446508-Alexandrium_andersonii.AAC.1